jgi:N4-gp56 family major capsid protein
VTIVQFQIYQDLAPVTAPLTENIDPDPVGIPNTRTVEVQINEWGNQAVLTRKLRLFALSDVTQASADILAYNLVDSLDRQVMGFAAGGSNVFYENGGALKLTGGARNAVASTDTLKSRDLRAAVALLRGRNALPRNQELFTCVLHPDQSYDLRSESDLASWRPPHDYSAAQNIWAGAVGVYEGCYVVETPRMTSAQDGAGTTTRATVYRTAVLGRQALARCVAEEPHTVVGPVTDGLRRFLRIGWYGVEGWNRYREECLQRIETSSSLSPPQV